LVFRKPVLALILSLVIAFSFIALIQLEKNSSLSFNLNTSLSKFSFLTPAFSNQPAFEDVIKEAQFPLIENATRADVYEFIVANPGIQFRGICTGLGIAIGTAEFHLGVLKKAGLISFVRDGKFKRFFASRKFSQKEMKLIALLRHETIREILKTILSKKTISHCKLASDLSITSQGLTWQMSRLQEEGIIQENCAGMKVTYSINELYAQELPKLLFMTEQ
jgi:DNA-binding transcriptional ArsR family regulator